MSARDRATMSENEVAAFLAEARTLNVATLGPDGAIHIVAMWFVMRGTSPVFWTYAKSQKARNLSRDARLSALVEGGESYDTLRGVELIGTAEADYRPGAGAAHRRGTVRQVRGSGLRRRPAPGGGQADRRDPPPGPDDLLGSPQAGRRPLSPPPGRPAAPPPAPAACPGPPACSRLAGSRLLPSARAEGYAPGKPNADC